MDKNTRAEMAQFYLKSDYIFATIQCYVCAFGIVILLFLPKLVQYIDFKMFGQCYTNPYYYWLKVPFFPLLILNCILIVIGIAWRKNIKKCDNSFKEGEDKL